MGFRVKKGRLTYKVVVAKAKGLKLNAGIKPVKKWR